MIASIIRGQRPLLLRINGSSANEPVHTLPKLPPSAITCSSRGEPPVPLTSMVRTSARSLLLTLIVPQ